MHDFSRRNTAASSSEDEVMSLQQFDGILKMKNTQNDRKRKSYKSAESLLEIFFVKSHQGNLRCNSLTHFENKGQTK